jgi:hypothetical protein
MQWMDFPNNGNKSRAMEVFNSNATGRAYRFIALHIYNSINYLGDPGTVIFLEG